MISRRAWKRPLVAMPYAKSILGPIKASEELRPFSDDHPVEGKFQKVLQFDPSPVGKLLTGPKSTGKTFLNNMLMEDLPHLSVDFRGRVACTADIIAEMDRAFLSIPQAFHGKWSKIGDIAGMIRKGATIGTGLVHGATGLLEAEEIPKWVEQYLKASWGVANLVCQATERSNIKDPIERWETLIMQHAEKCVSSNNTVLPMYVHLEELNAAMPHPDKRVDMPAAYREQMDFFTRLMAMLVRVTKQNGKTQVIMTTTDHSLQQVVKEHWGGGFAHIYCLGYMDRSATMNYMTNQRVADEKTRELIWQTCGGSFPHLDNAINFVHQGNSSEALAKSLEGDMNQAVGVVEGKFRAAKVGDRAEKIKSALASDGFVPRRDIDDEVFAKLIEANAVSVRLPCEIEEFALDLPEPARKIECVIAYNPREHAALRRIFKL